MALDRDVVAMLVYEMVDLCDQALASTIPTDNL